MTCWRWKAALAAGIFGATLAAGAAASAPAAQSSIPFADHGGIYDWRANGDKGIWVQSIGGQWFYATFMGTCVGLDTALRIGFQVEPTGEFDRWSSVVVPHEPRCHLSTFEPSAGPPAHGRAMG